MGAWIETRKPSSASPCKESHPTWVRGLKHCFSSRSRISCPSHPTWVRGLKLNAPYEYEQIARSHPTWVRGLKPVLLLRVVQLALSHPTWVRGLKHAFVAELPKLKEVAPYVGAWIETGFGSAIQNGLQCRTLRGCVD